MTLSFSRIINLLSFVLSMRTINDRTDSLEGAWRKDAIGQNRQKHEGEERNVKISDHLIDDRRKFT